MNSLCDKTCESCIYGGRVSNREYSKMYVCNYLIKTKKRRPCRAGKGCTVRKRARKTGARDDCDA